MATCECYLSILETTEETLTLVDIYPSEVPIMNLEGWDPILDAEEECLRPIEDLKEVIIVPHTHQVTNI